MSNAAERGALLEKVVFSFRDRKELCGVILATFRVELTHLLSSLADEEADEAHLDRIMSIAAHIGTAAAYAKLPDVRTRAMVLEQSAAAARVGGEREESRMLAAGLHVIEQILAESPKRTTVESGEKSLLN